MIQLKYLYFCLIVFLNPILPSLSVSLDEFGYYKIVVAINERTVQNSIENYVDNIKMGIQDLSDLLHYATNGKFSIKEANILVPNHWNVPTDGFGTTQYYEEADLKISHTFDLPFVNNPTPCGFHGSDIQLPYSFFDDGDNGRYGRLGKALLVQFARLRFGVWEEHGYPGDEKFPYYYKDLSGDQWEVNVCTDAPIEGEYKSIIDESPCGPDPEEVDPLYPPPSDCRFYPHNSQIAKSSLMSYHYLSNFEAFCTNETHNRMKPTPQNFYCRYKSVMEVIEGSSDWKTVVRENVPGRVDMKVLKTSTPPLLYILLDSGITQISSQILSEISNKLNGFITSRGMRDVVVGVGKYPAEDPDKFYQDVVPFNLVRDNTQLFISAFNSTFGKVGGFKDYGGALKSLITTMNERKHPTGFAILIVKTSPEPNTGSLTTEGEVLMPLLLGNTKLFAIEAHANPRISKNAFERIAEKSEGSHLTVKEPKDFEEPFDDFLSELISTFQSTITNQRSYFLASKELLVQADDDIVVKTSSNIVQFEAFALPLIGEASGVSFLSIENGTYENITLSQLEPVWDGAENIPVSKRVFHYSSIDHSDSPLDSLRWDTFSISCSGSCRILVMILVQVENPLLISQDFRLTVSTTAINNVADFSIMNAGTDMGVAFAVYAKLEQDGIPIVSVPGLEVKAILTKAGSSELVELPLIDDGKIIPDAVQNDGIFSGIFIPRQDGLYKIFVTAKYVIPEEDTFKAEDYLTPTSSVGRLFPVDQGRIGCGSGYLGCWNQAPEDDFFITTELEDPVQFINVNQLLRVVDRIVDLKIDSLPNNTIYLEWTHPGERTADGLIQADAFYEIRLHSEFDNLIFNFESSENHAGRVEDPRQPGTKYNITHPFGFSTNRYYAIRTAIYGPGGVENAVTSEIVGVRIREDVIPTTTTTTTTIRPTRSTTLPPTTTQPGSSTTEDSMSSTTTTHRTTISRSTTARPTTTPTTTPPPTTTGPPQIKDDPEKHWFKKTEGIITLSVFGAGLLLLVVGGFGFLWFTKYR